MMKKCIGCGVELQMEDIKKPGYIKDINQDYCQRCFRMTHYNDLTINMKNRIERKAILDKIREIDGLLVLIVDILQIEFALRSDLIEALKGKDIVLVLNKYDVLPKNVNLERILEYINRYTAKHLKNTRVHEVLLTQKFDEGFNNLFLDVVDESGYRSIYFVGNVNAGKSTIINKLLKDKKLTESRYPSTTLDFNVIPYDEYLFIDTPGLIDESSLICKTEQSNLKQIEINKMIKPLVYQLYENQSYAIDGILKIDVYTKNPKSSIIFYGSPLLNIHRSGIENGSIYFDKHHKEFPLHVNDAYIKEIKIGHDREDILINGLGIITVKGVNRVVITTQKGVEILERESII